MIINIITAEKRVNKNGEEFLVYKARGIDGAFFDIKFTRATQNAPKEEGTYIIKYDEGLANKDAFNKYNVYWIKEIEGFTKIEFKES